MSLNLIKEMLEAWTDQFGPDACDCRTEPENAGHCCPWCQARALLEESEPSLYQADTTSRLRYASEEAYDNNERPVGMRCDCGCLLPWSPGCDETCDECHTEYNSSGTQLAPRHQWGEETGESFGVGGEF